MLKGLLVLLLSAFLFSCAWKFMDPGSESESEIEINEPTNEELREIEEHLDDYMDE